MRVVVLVANAGYSDRRLLWGLGMMLGVLAPCIPLRYHRLGSNRNYSLCELSHRAFRPIFPSVRQHLVAVLRSHLALERPSSSVVSVGVDLFAFLLP